VTGRGVVRTSVGHYWRNAAIAATAFGVCVIGVLLLVVNGVMWGVGSVVGLWRAAFPDALVCGATERVRIDGRLVLAAWGVLAILFGLLVARRPKTNLAIFAPMAVAIPIIVFYVTIRVIGFRLE